ncbi:hypothetical protein LTR08_003326 [Meristemomyces frigidus]|nr:hypothetical protein LTR08_003326 [Meristemomyces frigidus]
MVNPLRTYRDLTAAVTGPESPTYSELEDQPELLSLYQPTALIISTETHRGRPPKRVTSSNRVGSKRDAVKRFFGRKPLTPTTKTANTKERKHRMYIKKREAEAEMARVLRMPATYWRVLRNGKKYRSLGGTRAL